MNWQGGSLSRTRNSKSSLSVIQKKHFAKVRGRLQTGQPSPPPIEFFESGEWRAHPNATTGQTQELGRSRGRARSQRTLDDFDNTAPIARKLGSLKPRVVTRRRERYPSSIVCSPSIKQRSKLPALNSIEQTRQYLLGKSDWVGVEQKQPPVKIKFADPKDRDLIGKRRRVSKSHDVQLEKNSKHLKRTSLFHKPNSTPHSNDDYWSHGNVSVRIGSAVDRSVRKGDGRTSDHGNFGQNIGSASDEMLLDHEYYGQTPNPFRQMHKVKSPHQQVSLGPGFEHPGSRTPSPSIDMSPSPAASPRILLKSTISGSNTLLAQKLLDEDDAASLVVDEQTPFTDFEPTEIDPVFRLVFENTPRPYVQTSVKSSESPAVRDIAIPWPKIYDNSQEIVQSSKSKAFKPAGANYHEESQFRIEASNKSPLSVATSSYLSDLRNEMEEYAKIKKASKDEDRSIDSPKKRNAGKGRTTGGTASMHKHSNNAKVDPSLLPHKLAARTDQQNITIEDDLTWHAVTNVDPVLMPLGHPGDESVPPNKEEELLWQELTNVDESTDQRRWEAQPTEMKGQNESPISTLVCEQHTVGEIDADAQKIIATKSEVFNDEEEIWRNFVFSDEDQKSDWILEEPEAPPSSAGPAQTQPSMIAEVSTSPLKQHPHLTDVEISIKSSPNKTPCTVETPSNSTKTQNSTTHSPIPPQKATSAPHLAVALPKDSYHGTQNSPTFSKIAACGSDPSSFLAEAPQYAKQKAAFDADASSLLAEMSSLLAEAEPSLPERSNLDDSQAHHLPKQPDRAKIHPSSSSLDVQVSNSSAPRPLVPASILSSDELAHSPSRFPISLPKPPVLFKKPSRYVGTRSADVPEPVILGGRVLRNGKRTGEVKGKRKGKERRGSRNDRENDGDEIVDD
ncbi:hypothetical protein MMC28_006627 [Mycoblastus sanguinarius]|nr:hypothetical protein [Mycoblastus sanguinarius]